MSPSDKPKERPAQKRSPMSCERCKNRKTKCLDPLPGPCQLCVNTGSVCRVDMSRRRQRPYYQVSEEQFRYMTKALNHFMPNMTLDLPSLRSFVITLNDGSSHDKPETASSKVASPATSMSSGGTRPSISIPETRLVPSTVVSLDEIDEIQGRASWLRVDSAGNHRYVGGEGTHAFHSAVQSAKARQLSSFIDSDILSTDTAQSTVPSGNIPTTASVSMPRRIYLPRRDLCNKSVTRFFQDIHSVYWLFAVESFQASLDSLYSGDMRSATPSMLCSLYSILAMTCESEGKMYGGASVATSPPSRYLALAKEMTPELYDKADVGSIRALCLLAMAHQSSCPDQAYLYIGSAARIAYTLGLHIKKETHARPMFQRQLELRIFCTIYLLDMDIALIHGYPPALGEVDAVKDLHLTTEQILCPGSNILPGYQVVASQLSQLSRCISTLLYVTPDSAGRTRFLADVMGCVSTLHTWMDDLPLPLRNCKDATQCHGRSIAILHLRYYSTMILATRPFLLHTALSPGESGIEAKRKTFQDLAMLCIDAASQSLDILQHMQVSGLISSLVSLDATFLMEDIRVFLLVVSANTRRESGLDVSHKAYACLEILQSMEQVQGVKSTLDKALAQLKEYGVIDASNGLVRKEPTRDQLFLGMESTQALPLYLNAATTMRPGLSNFHQLIFEKPH